MPDNSPMARHLCIVEFSTEQSEAPTTSRYAHRIGPSGQPGKRVHRLITRDELPVVPCKNVAIGADGWTAVDLEHTPAADRTCKRCEAAYLEFLEISAYASAMEIDATHAQKIIERQRLTTTGE